MTAKDLEAGVITIDNEYIDTNANEYDMTWELIRDGKPVAHNTQSVDVPPQETVDITLEGYTAPANLQPGEEIDYCRSLHPAPLVSLLSDTTDTRRDIRVPS